MSDVQTVTCVDLQSATVRDVQRVTHRQTVTGVNLRSVTVSNIKRVTQTLVVTHMQAGSDRRWPTDNQ